jgi:hypothetical protein
MISGGRVDHRSKGEIKARSIIRFEISGKDPYHFLSVVRWMMVFSRFRLS